LTLQDGHNDCDVKKQDEYIPALSFDWLTPLYDPLIKWLMPESKFKKHLIREANIKAGQRVLDVGCGTGTLAILVKQIHADAEVFGLDGDTKILKIAQKKAAEASVEIALHKGLAFHLPYADKSFDRVLSSLMLHHLTPENKRLTLAEMFRVLRPLGELHIADFKKSNKSLTAMLRETGFEKIEEYAEYKTIFGKLLLWSAQL
jgi:ubiquinone/menaquinone biosynthesis C-methylase UbiE